MTNRRNSQRGGSAVEFALSTLFWVPLLLGTLTVGFKLVRANQVETVCRDTGHMYAAGVDFSQSANKAIVVRLAAGLGMTATDGDGVMILSLMKKIGPTDCTSSGYVPANQTPNSSNCPNLNQTVIAQRNYIGLKGLRNSDFVTPADSLLSSTGDISLTQQVSNTALQSASFSNLLTLGASQVAFLTETYFSAPDTNQAASLSTGIFTRSIF